MRVLLIYPPFYRFLGYYNRYFPYGLLSLGTYLKREGHDVLIYDADYNQNPSDLDISRASTKYASYLAALKNPFHPIWQEVRETIKIYRPDVVGIQVYTDFCASAFYVAEACKLWEPKVHVVMGGAHINAKAQEVLDVCHAVDYVIEGEGEIPFSRLLEQLKSGTSQPDEIPGVWSRSSRRIAGRKELVENLDDLPSPDRGLLLNETKYTSEDMGLIMTTRGCPFQCTFCATQTHHSRFRSMDLVLDEICHVKAKYGTVQFTFKDDTFIVKRERVIEFCEKLLRMNLRINWECNGRADLIDRDLVRLMRQAGCNFIKIGVESGSQNILQKMKKGITLEELVAGAEVCREVGIHWTGYFMIGVPGETEEDMRETLTMMRTLKPDFAYLGVYQPYPGTVMFDEGIDLGLIQPSMSYDEFFRIPPDQYYKVRPVRQVETMDQTTFKKLEDELMSAFHRHNKNIFRIVKMVNARCRLYSREPVMLFRDFKKYLAY